jgi:hypothetical protein
MCGDDRDRRTLEGRRAMEHIEKRMLYMNTLLEKYLRIVVTPHLPNMLVISKNEQNAKMT